MSRIYLYWVMALALPMYAQEYCWKPLADAVAKLSDLSKLPAHQMLYYEMHYTMVPTDTLKAAPTTAKMKIQVCHTMAIVDNGKSVSYMDSNVSFMVVEPSKMIVWKNSSELYKGFKKSNVDLFQNIASYDCSKHSFKGKDYDKIVCWPNEIMKKEHHIQKVEYLMNKELIYRVRVYYDKALAVNYVESIYNQVAYIPLDPVYENGAEPLFFKKGTHKLLAKYTNYTLQEIRR